MGTAVGSGTSVSPANLTAADLIRSVLDYIQGGDDDELRDVAKRELNMAIDELNSYNWRRLVSSQDITLGAGDDEYELASNFKEPTRAVLYLGTTRKLRMQYAEWQDFHDRFDDRTHATSPGFYTIDYDTRMLVLEGTPSASFIGQYDTLKLWYYIRLSYLAQDSDMHGGPPEFNTFLIWRARAGIAAIRGNDPASVRAEVKADRILRNLRVNDGLASTDWE